MSGTSSKQSYDLSYPDNIKLRIRNGRCRRCVRVPTSIALTPRVLLEAMRKLPIEAIHKTVDQLIDELNQRYGDADFEPEPLEESE
jgi:hypothetical protein